MKFKIIFILPSLKAGGAERVLSFLAKSFHDKNNDVKLVVLGFEKDKVFDTGKLNVVYLNKSRLLLSLRSLFMILSREKPQIVFGSIGHINLMLGFFSFYFKQIKFIGREASVISKMNEFSTKSSKLYLLLIRFFYPKLAAIVCQSSEMEDDLKRILKKKSNNIKVIHNPLTNPVVKFQPKPFSNIVNFITVGRLSQEKGHERIIEGLSKLTSFDFIYTIIGSGPLEIELRGFLKKYGLVDRVRFISYSSEVLRYLKKSDYFVQGSYVEGFPNTLLESCSVGTPVIAFDCPGGTKDIVINNVNGFLVSDLYEFIQLINNKEKLKSIKYSEVQKSVSQKFSSEKIVKQYENLFLSYTTNNFN